MFTCPVCSTKHEDTNPQDDKEWCSVCSTAFHKKSGYISIYTNKREVWGRLERLRAVPVVGKLLYAIKLGYARNVRY